MGGRRGFENFKNYSPRLHCALVGRPAGGGVGRLKQIFITYLQQLHDSGKFLAKICLNNQFSDLSKSPLHKHLGTRSSNLRLPVTKDKTFAPWTDSRMAILFPGITLKIATSNPTSDEHRWLIGHVSAAPGPPDRHEAKHYNIQNVGIVVVTSLRTNLQKLCWHTCISRLHVAVQATWTSFTHGQKGVSPAAYVFRWIAQLLCFAAYSQSLIICDCTISRLWIMLP